MFLTTHYLDEADALCDRVFIIDNGVTVASGTPDELKRQVSGDVVTLAVNGAADKARELLARQPIVGDVTVSDDGGLRLNVVNGAEALPSLLRVLDDAGITLHSINLSRPTLDDVFLTMTGRSLRDDSPSAAAAGQPEPRAAAHARGQGVAAMSFIHDTLVVFRRELRLSLRNPAWVVIVLVQPVLYLVLFGPLLTRLPAGTLGGSVGPGSPAGAADGVPVLRARAADPARAVRLDVRRVRDHLGLARRGDRAVPGHPGVAAGGDERPGAARHSGARGAGGDPGARRHRRSGCARRSARCSSASASSSWWPSASPRCRTRPP